MKEENKKFFYMTPVLEMTDKQLRRYTAFLTKTELALLVSKGRKWNVIDSYKSIKKIDDYIEKTKIVIDMLSKGKGFRDAKDYGISKSTFLRRKEALKRYRYLDYTTPNKDEIRHLTKDEFSVFVAKQDPLEQVVARQKAILRAVSNVRSYPQRSGINWLDERIRDAKKLKCVKPLPAPTADKLKARSSFIGRPFCYGVDNVF